jgi:hypothetical protein
MSDINDTQPDPYANTQPAGFCQNCGRPLNKETIRIVGPAVYCEPCLDAKLGGATAAASGYTPVNTAGPTGWSATPSEPNPGLAFLLGLIPGVGAMYNEQYAKGLVHLTIFAVLVALAHASGLFGLFIAGWVFYMAIEAHHTAQAKRDGTPLPNPFGLNDIGERMGFGSGWTSPQSVAGAARDAASAAGFRPAPATATPGQPEPPPQPGAGWGAPVDAYPPPYTPPYTAQDWRAHAQQYAQAQTQQAYEQVYGQGYPPYASPYTAPGAPMPPPVPPFPAPRNRFPAGAIWLIALGTLFLLGTEGIFRGLRGETLVGILFLFLAGTVFVRRMTAFGGKMEDDGSPNYQFRLMYALRPTVWLLLTAVVFLLDAFNILRWAHSWPFFIILAGVMMLLGRAPYHAPYPYPEAAPPAAPATPGTEITRLNLQPDDKDDIGSHKGGY